MSTEITEQHLRQMIMEDHEDELKKTKKPIISDSFRRRLADAVKIDLTTLTEVLDQANRDVYEKMTREEKTAAIGRLKLKTESDMRTCEKTCELLDAELQKLEEETE